MKHYKNLLLLTSRQLNVERAYDVLCFTICYVIFSKVWDLQSYKGFSAYGSFGDDAPYKLMSHVQYIPVAEVMAMALFDELGLRLPISFIGNYIYQL